MNKAMQLVHEVQSQLTKEEQRKAQENPEKATRHGKRSSIGRRAQPLLHSTAKPGTSWEPELPSMGEREDLMHQLEELAQQRWKEEQPPKLQDAAPEAPAQQLRQQNQQVCDTAGSVSEKLLQQLQTLDIRCTETALIADNKFVGAHQRKGEGSMASTKTPCSERGGTRDVRTGVTGAASKAVPVTDSRGLAKARRKAAPRKVDGKGNGRVFRRKAAGNDQLSANSTGRRPVVSQARQAHTIVLERKQVSPTPFTCPVLVSCQACPEKHFAPSHSLA